MTIRRPVLTCFILFTVAGCAMAQQAPAPPAGAPAGGAAAAAGEALSPDSSVDAVLDALDARGKSLKDFTADVSLAEADPVTALETTRLGSVKYQKLGDGNARLRVVFDKKKTDRGTRDEVLEYLLEGGWLTDRDYRTKIQVKRQVLRPGEQIDLLKLGEGPFPLPLGQAKEDVHKLFDVTKEPPGDDAPAGTVHVKLTPKAGTQFADKFESIDVWVDTKTEMPRRIITVDTRGGAERITDLTNVKVNGGLADADFQLKPVEGWQLTEEPYRE